MKDKIVSGSKKVVLTHHRALGDCLMFSSMLRDIKLLYPELEIGYNCSFNDMLANHPYATALDMNAPDVSVISTGNSFINKVGKSNHHMSEDFFMYTIYKLAGYGIIDGSIGNFYKKLQDPILKSQGFLNCRPCINITKKEKEIRWLKDLYGVNRYWVVAAGGKNDFQTKIWHWSSFQSVIDYFKGFIKFVIIGKSGHVLNTNLKDCIYLTDKTSPRDLYHLVYHADGVVSGISALMHIAAGLKNYKDIWTPCVNIKGCREQISYTYYDNHQILQNYDGFECSGCWKGKVTEDQRTKPDDRVCHRPVWVGDDGRGEYVPECMKVITYQDVIRAIQIYYEGCIYKGALERQKLLNEIRSKKEYYTYQAQKFKKISNFL